MASLKAELKENSIKKGDTIRFEKPTDNTVQPARSKTVAAFLKDLPTIEEKPRAKNRFRFLPMPLCFE